MTCAVCRKNKGTIEQFTETFTDLDGIKGGKICERCQPLFSGKWLKTAFYFHNNEKRNLKQNEIADILFKKMEFPCLISFSKSRKKHRLFRTKTSYAANDVILSTDDGDIHLNQNEDKKIFLFLEKLYNDYAIKKEDLLNNFESSFALKKIGMANYFLFKKIIKKIKGTPKYEFLIDIINKYERTNAK